MAWRILAITGVGVFYSVLEDRRINQSSTSLFQGVVRMFTKTGPSICYYIRIPAQNTTHPASPPCPTPQTHHIAPSVSPSSAGSCQELLQCWYKVDISHNVNGQPTLEDGGSKCRY